MALTLTAMLTEVYARGFSFLNDSGAGTTRVTRAINDAMHSVDDEELWDYRHASTTGTSPVTVSDLGVIENVLDGTNLNPLAGSTLDELLDTYGEVTTAGTAAFYYVSGGTISSYPVSSQTLTVRYWRVGPDLSSGSDVPLMPDRFRMAIVERACAYLYRDQDDPEMASVCKQEANEILDRMRLVYVLQPGGSRQIVTGASGDW